MASYWNNLVSMAQPEVNCTLRSLPRQLRVQARKLPITYEPQPSQQLVDEGLDPDTLGLFVGGEFAETHDVMPAQIILFLENIWEMICDEGGGAHEFRQEVRTTLLHELGHYLGLNEDELEQRGLL